MFDDVSHLASWGSGWLHLLSRQVLFSTLLCIPVAVLGLWRRRRWPHLLYGLWMLVLLRLILPPGLTTPWSLEIPVEGYEASWVSNLGTPRFPPNEVASAARGAQSVILETTLEEDAASPVSISLPLLGFGLWLLGASFCGAIFLRRSLAYRRLLSRAQTIKDSEILDCVEQWRRRFGIRRPVRCITTKTPSSEGAAGAPFTAGLLRPRVFLPRALVDGPLRTEVEQVIAHELAHIRRWDYLWIRLQGWLQVIYFFHPAVWLAAGELNRIRETLCDQLVLEEGTISRRRYGRSLLAVLDLQTKAGAGALLPMPALGHHHRRWIMRIEEIVHHQLPSRRSRWAAWITTLVVAVLFLPMVPESEADASTSNAKHKPYTAELQQTVDDLKRIGSAVHAWSLDQIENGETQIARANDRNHLVDGRMPISYFASIDAEKLRSLLEPQFIDPLPTHDGWGRPYDFRVNSEDLGSNQLVMVRSAGRNGVFEEDAYPVGSFHASAEDSDDIVHADGYFVAWPVPDP